MRLKRLKVIKADGSTEQYLHTKVIGSFNYALDLIDQPNVFAAEQFAEAVTFHLYKKNQTHTVTSEEIFLMVLAVLDATGYGNAALALRESHLNRKLRRRRIEVIKNTASGPDDIESITCQWNKSIIAEDLVKIHGFDRQIARAIASTVEQKVLSLGITRIPSSLIKQLVFIDMDTTIKAEKQLQMATG